MVCLFKVLVPKDENLMGKLVDVEITETGKHFMKCRLLGDGVRPRDVPPPLQKGEISGVKKVSPSTYLKLFSKIRAFTFLH